MKKLSLGKDNHQAAVQLVCYTAVFRVVTQRSSPLGGALRDDTKNGCVADYRSISRLRIAYTRPDEIFVNSPAPWNKKHVLHMVFV